MGATCYVKLHEPGRDRGQLISSLLLLLWAFYFLACKQSGGLGRFWAFFEWICHDIVSRKPELLFVWSLYSSSSQVWGWDIWGHWHQNINGTRRPQSPHLIHACQWDLGSVDQAGGRGSPPSQLKDKAKCCLLTEHVWCVVRLQTG